MREAPITSSESTTPVQLPPTQPSEPAQLSGSAGIPAGESESQLLSVQPKPAKGLPISLGPIGAVEALSESEEARVMGCEAVVSMGWHTFVEVGLAFAQIRDERLYRVQFTTFEAYCQAKWQDGRNYVNRLISAAQVFRHLVTFSHLV